MASVREALLLERAMLTARSYPDATRVIALARAAHEASLVADRALEDRYLACALSLYREAALLLMAAILAGTPGSEPIAEPLSRAAVLARFRELPLRGAASAEVFYASLEHEPPLGVAPSRSEAEDARDAVRWLAKLIEPRGLRELRVERGVRLGLAGVAVVAAVAWAISGVAGHKNVALHKPVTVSSVHPGALSPPAGLTDGVISGALYGVHTQVGDAPWVQVDLESVTEIDEVRVYNRGDGYFDEGLPMTLQFSEDGSTFTDLEKRTTSFSQGSPWVAKANGRKARYVRVRGAPGKYVALSELEIYAK
jgi:hypothetical protein